MMNDDEILHVQRALRRRLFEGGTAISWRPGRELMAQLLLYLDDAEACWRITTGWLRETLDADRVDGGFGGFIGEHGQPNDYLVIAESQREALMLPSVLGARFHARDAGLHAVWAADGPAAVTNVSQETRFISAGVRDVLASVGTTAKIAIPVRDGKRPVGLVCADWQRVAPRWNAEVCNRLGDLARDALGPLLATTARLAEDATEAPPQAVDCTSHVARAGDWCNLTSAELRVARLVATGLSYKEVARQLDRSLSTVDHQLRSIRQKLGVSSTARLVHLLSEHPDHL